MSDQPSFLKSSLPVTAPSGAVVDLGPLITAARNIRRNALQDEEHERESSASRVHLAAVALGMKIAVTHLLGDEALAIFSEEVSRSR